MRKAVAFIIILAFLFAIPAYAQGIRIAYSDTTLMTAPGNSAAIHIGGRYSKIMWFFKVSNINSSVDIALQIKAGFGSWVGVWSDSITYEANGDYALEWDSVALADSIRFTWISEGGGTDALVRHNSILVGGD